jgi:hypothetical protein
VSVNDAKAETVQVRATISVGGVDTDVSGSPASLAFAPGAPSAAYSSLTIDSPTAITVGSAHVLTVTLRDALDNIATGADLSKVAFSCPIDTTCGTVSGSDGVFTTTITSTKAGSYSVSATYDGVSVGAPDTVDANFQAGSAANIALTPASSTVDQGSTATLTATVTDAYGNPQSATVTATVTGSATVAPSCNANASGQCTLDVTDAAAETVTVTATLASTTASAAASVNFADVTPPSAPDVTTANGSELAGTGEPDATVTVTWPDGTTGSVVVDPGGNWSIPTPPGMPSGSVTTSQTDPSGNKSPDVSNNLVTSNGAVPKISVANKTEVSGSAAPPGSTVTVTFPDGKKATTVAKSDGTWSISTPSGMKSGDVTATTTDSHGNVSPAATKYLDADAPPAPPITLANQTEVAGTGEPGDTVTLTWPDGSTSSTKVLSDGTWSVPTPNGMTGDVLATATDPAGNMSPASSRTIDTGPPPPAITTSNNSEIAGTGEPGNTITVKFPDGTVKQVVVDPDGTWSVPVPSGMRPGKVTVTQTDPAGYVSDPAYTTLKTVPGDLPFTGVQLTGMLTTLGSCLLLGFMLILLARRRRRASEEDRNAVPGIGGN